jgi:hypothetical protein
MNDPKLQCPDCKHMPAVAEYLGQLSSWWPQIETLRHVCSSCGCATELQLELDKLLIGYVYAAGRAHFVPEIEVPIAGLAVDKSADAIEIHYCGETWTVSS